MLGFFGIFGVFVICGVKCELYVRKHWFEVLTDSGETLKIYFERQARSRNARARWWLFSIDKP